RETAWKYRTSDFDHWRRGVFHSFAGYRKYHGDFRARTDRRASSAQGDWILRPRGAVLCASGIAGDCAGRRADRIGSGGSGDSGGGRGIEWSAATAAAVGRGAGRGLGFRGFSRRRERIAARHRRDATARGRCVEEGLTWPYPLFTTCA